MEKGTFPMRKDDMIYLVFSTPTCVWCHRAISLLEDKGLQVAVTDITKDKEAREWLVNDQLHQTVPQVYLRNSEGQIVKHIGGYNDLVEYFKKITH